MRTGLLKTMRLLRHHLKVQIRMGAGHQVDDAEDAKEPIIISMNIYRIYDCRSRIA